MVTQWDWTTHTTYEFRTNRICARFRYEFVKELFDFTMADAIDVLEKRGREIDMVHGADPRRTKRLATITGVFRRGDKAGAGCLSELMDQIQTRKRAGAFIKRAGIAIDDLKTALAEIDQVMLPNQKSMRLLVQKSDAKRNGYIDKLVEQGLGNNLALLEGARTAAQRKKLARATGIPGKELLDLVHRADMGRQGCMARMVEDFYDVGYHSMEKFRAVDPEQARTAGIDLRRVLYARTRPRVLKDVPKLPTPELKQGETKAWRPACGNNCSSCTGPWGCAFEKCVRHNRVPSCAHCSAFPCDAYDGRKDTKHLKKVRAKLKPEEILPMKPLREQRPVVVDFPDELKLPAARKRALRPVRNLLVAARELCSGNSYARRQMMAFPRRHAFDVLWCMAHHGELVLKPRPHLYLHRGTCRRDGQRMPDAHAQEGVWRHLPGLKVEEKRSAAKHARPVNDDECRMFLVASAGGGEALRMLRRFADGLCQRYGEPEWKGHRVWKGEAFQRFLAADVACVASAVAGAKRKR